MEQGNRHRMEFSREEGESDGKGNRTEREGEREREMLTEESFS